MLLLQCISHPLLWSWFIHDVKSDQHPDHPLIFETTRNNPVWASSLSFPFISILIFHGHHLHNFYLLLWCSIFKWASSRIHVLAFRTSRSRSRTRRIKQYSLIFSGEYNNNNKLNFWKRKLHNQLLFRISLLVSDPLLLLCHAKMAEYSKQPGANITPFNGYKCPGGDGLSG